ncbi:hypothetical protein WICPIJ_003286 [Wickerhamomyces pijperi]|uniref:RRM domain-containing protein n=1 Tax=Wickerhamomyces pijperi TaxID=599730 RepID=A0A9P8Q9Y1_WICPI|nr:hypothetical protein WICPIJ_003286 [Wickerhamomyces pijperi]
MSDTEKPATPVAATAAAVAAEPSKKLTKKEKKALEFRNKSKGKETPVEQSTTEEPDKKRKLEADAPAEGEKKKRKTRRGKKGKGNANATGGPRFLLFVGNLPYDINQAELMAHFAASKPDRIRIRTEKGIAFLEFDGEGGEIQHRMEVALRMHRSTLRNRKINVELTVGGGGNSKDRLEKIKTKNDTLEIKRRERIMAEKKAEREKTIQDQKKVKQMALEGNGNIHPSRLKLLGK